MSADLQICIYVQERVCRSVCVCIGNQWACRPSSCSRRASFSSSKVEIFWFLTLTSCWMREKIVMTQERRWSLKNESSDCVQWRLEGCPISSTCVSTALCHRRAPSDNVSGREASLLREMLGSFITEPREPFTRWIRDLSRHDWACTDTHEAL